MNFEYEPLDFSDYSFPFIFHRACDGEFPPHWHDSLEIHCIYQGRECIVIDSLQIPVGPTDIVCISSGQTHWYTNPFHLKYHTLIVHPSLLKKCGIDPTSVLIPCFKDPYVTDCFKKIVQEDGAKQPYYQASIKSEIMALLVHLYRNHRGENLPIIRSEQTSQISIATKILEYIKENYTNNITIAMIGNALGISPNYLCTCFQKATKTSINKYINSLRCWEARNLLLDGKETVTDIALRCGFSNMSYFSKVYCGIIGESPSTTLKRVRKIT